MLVRACCPPPSTAIQPAAAGGAAGTDIEGVLARWSGQRTLALERVDRLAEELSAAGQIDLAMLSVATAELRSLV